MTYLYAFNSNINYSFFVIIQGGAEMFPVLICVCITNRSVEVLDLRE